MDTPTALDVPLWRVHHLAMVWATSHPDLRPRLERAVPLAARVTPTGQGAYDVEGSNDTYAVRIVPTRTGYTSTCTCPDSCQGNRCKHRLALALALTARVPDPEIVTQD